MYFSPPFGSIKHYKDTISSVALPLFLFRFSDNGLLCPVLSNHIRFLSILKDARNMTFLYQHRGSEVRFPFLSPLSNLRLPLLSFLLFSHTLSSHPLLPSFCTHCLPIHFNDSLFRKPCLEFRSCDKIESYKSCQRMASKPKYFTL